MKHSDDPMLRMAAAKQAEKSHAQDPARIAALHEMLWRRGRGAEERQYAIDQLVAYDEQDFRQILSRRLVLIVNPETLRYVLEMAAERQWTELTPAIVRSYARQIVTNIPGPRPEEAALQALNPGKTIVEIVFDTFINTREQASINEQTAAWQLLRRLTDAPGLMKLLAAAPDTTPLVIDLKASASQLRTLPHGREGVLRLSTLRSPAYAALWQQQAELVSKLTDEQQQGLELRHLPVLLSVDQNVLSMGRQQLLDRVRQYLARQEHHLRGPTYDGPMRDYPQEFSAYASDLPWADLATIDLLARVILENRSVQAELFAQADRDKLDTSSEHGGVLLLDDGRYQARAFSPMQRQNDYKFFPSQEMIDTLYRGVAHYHFHAQAHHNRDYAGPGMGDMRMARTLEAHCIVLTFINADTLNVDYYQPGGQVIDLGTIKR